MNSYVRPTGESRTFSLHHLLNELLNRYAKVKRNHSYCFINDVPAHLVTTSDQVEPLLGDLFEIISSNPGYFPVHISATGFGRQVKLYVKKTLSIHIVL